LGLLVMQQQQDFEQVAGLIEGVLQSRIQRAALVDLAVASLVLARVAAFREFGQSLVHQEGHLGAPLTKRWDH
jgi:hypothetical protein